MATLLMERTEALVVFVDEESNIAAANPAALEASGCDRDELIGQPAESLVVPRHLPDFRRALRLALRNGAPGAYEFDLVQQDGEPQRSYMWSVSVVAHDPSVVACLGIDMTTTRNEFEALRSRAVTDQLTGLPNRAGLLEHLSGMTGSGACVVFCDLNGFKAVNDTHGHASGDEVLVHVARRLKQTVRGEDFVGRLGGDEFVIVVPPHPTQDFDGLADRLRSAMTQPMILTGRVLVNIGMSIGMSTLETGSDAAVVLNEADHAMYAMKQRGASVGITDASAEASVGPAAAEAP
ncbi:MAG: GGDEF domain-containing protein [Mycobacteriales bacterium]